MENRDWWATITFSLTDTRTRLGVRFFCIILLGDIIHRFFQFPITHMIWKYLSDIWHVLTCYYVKPQTWVFAQYVQNNSLTPFLSLPFFFITWASQSIFEVSYRMNPYCHTSSFCYITLLLLHYD